MTPDSVDVSIFDPGEAEPPAVLVRGAWANGVSSLTLTTLIAGWPPRQASTCIAEARHVVVGLKAVYRKWILGVASCCGAPPP
jgi:hypothetical protein